MPSIWKSIMRPKAEPYRFPKAEELVLEEEKPEPPPPPVSEEEPAEEAPLPDLRAGEEAKAPEPEPEPEPDPVSFAQIQAEQIIQDARRRAEDILDQARLEAEIKAQELFESSRQSGLEAGRAEGLAEGAAQALQEGQRARQRQAEELAAEFDRFLERAGAALDRQMEDNVEELRDLAIAIAEKVVSVSLKSSGEVICRMIQTAIDKRKRREWAHIYIAECDARHLSKVPASLMNALSALSDRVRIIPMADDEAGTCIIETPDEIVDASAATQMNNIRTLLSDAGPMEEGVSFNNLNFSGGL
ncbi:FliH/SctL family protein [uncultured Oscillibacter sp.]|uniref:FliH/SctL family protein n=1 Tax=uncultured Oscillibacter sp. TaxID=876091 RepID=UPI002617D287|nr:FliH/SctL family protein [uncultured Oscillibacter sp.]